MNEKILDRFTIKTTYGENKEYIYRLVERFVPLALRKFYYIEGFDPFWANFFKQYTIESRNEAYEYWNILLRRKVMSLKALNPFEYAINDDKMKSYSHLLECCEFIDFKVFEISSFCYDGTTTYCFRIQPNSTLLEKSNYSDYKKKLVPQWIHSIGFLQYIRINIEITSDKSAYIYYRKDGVKEPFELIDEFHEIHDFENMICHYALGANPTYISNIYESRFIYEQS